MPIRKSSVVRTPSGTTADRPANPSIGDTFFNGTLGVQEIYTSSGWIAATGANDFNVSITGLNTSVTFNKEYFAGAYTIQSSLSDSTYDIYLFNSAGEAAGYSNSPSITATDDFNKIVILGGTAGDLLSFSYKTTFTTSTETGQVNAGPYITSFSEADLGNLDDTTIITGGNFAENVAVTFTGTDNVVRNAKSVVRSSSSSLLVTRPDDFLENNSPYTVTVTNPGVSSPTGTNLHISSAAITAGGDPTWVTGTTLNPAFVNTAFSRTVEATDPDGSTITYGLVSSTVAGVSINSSTGEISGTMPGSSGAHSFVISATDESGNITNRTFSIQAAALPSGGTIVSSGGYRYHTFTSSGTLTMTSSMDVEYLMVAGGGGGGQQVGGGGGAGGLLSGSATLYATEYAIAIGAAGAGALNNANQGSNGGNTTFNNFTAIGGGRGSNHEANVSTAGSGGSGGGGSGNSNSQNVPGGAGTAGQGNNGGAGYASQWAGGGGGGATQIGANATPGVGGKGGDGSSAFSDWGIATSTGHNVSGTRWYAGGGGGAMTGGSGASNFSAGGLGGGAKGFGNDGVSINPGTTTGDNALTNTGGGGGGVRDWYSGTSIYTRAGNGGSGIVIVRYQL